MTKLSDLEDLSQSDYATLIDLIKWWKSVKRMTFEQRLQSKDCKDEERATIHRILAVLDKDRIKET